MLQKFLLMIWIHRSARDWSDVGLKSLAPLHSQTKKVCQILFHSLVNIGIIQRKLMKWQPFDGFVSLVRSHSANKLDPRRKSTQVFGYERADRVALVGPSALTFAKGIDNNKALKTSDSLHAFDGSQRFKDSFLEGDFGLGKTGREGQLCSNVVALGEEVVVRFETRSLKENICLQISSRLECV